MYLLLSSKPTCDHVSGRLIPLAQVLLLIHRLERNFCPTMAESQVDIKVPQTVQDVLQQTTQVESRLAWERVMGVENSTPVKYDKTSVLILGWEEDADDTRTAEDVSYLPRNQVKHAD